MTLSRFGIQILICYQILKFVTHEEIDPFIRLLETQLNYEIYKLNIDNNNYQIFEKLLVVCLLIDLWFSNTPWLFPILLLVKLCQIDLISLKSPQSQQLTQFTQSSIVSTYTRTCTNNKSNQVFKTIYITRIRNIS